MIFQRFLAGLLIFCFLSNVCFSQISSSESRVIRHQENLKKIFQQGQITNQGIEFEKRLRFFEAIAKYNEALQPQYLIEDRNKSYPLWRMNHVFRYQGEYQKALLGLDWFRQYGAGSYSLVEEEMKLNALIEWQKSGDKKMIYKFMEYINEKYRHWFPPHKLVPASTTYMADIAELYDLIGDYDNGIQWVESFQKKASKNKRTQEEYKAVLRAFEESKRGMPKVCGDDGKYCVGRATAVLIRSDYF